MCPRANTDDPAQLREAHVPVAFLGTHLCAQPRAAEAETLIQNGGASCTQNWGTLTASGIAITKVTLNRYGFLCLQKISLVFQRLLIGLALGKREKIFSSSFALNK